VLCSLLWVTLLGQGVGLGDPQRALPALTMLGFCDFVILSATDHHVSRKGAADLGEEQQGIEYTHNEEVALRKSTETFMWEKDD